jgi:hypothetical protein
LPAPLGAQRSIGRGTAVVRRGAITLGSPRLVAAGGGEQAALEHQGDLLRHGAGTPLKRPAGNRAA